MADTPLDPTDTPVSTPVSASPSPEAPTPVSPPVPDVTPVVQPAQTTKKSRRWLWLGLLILILIVAGGVVYWAKHHHTKTADTKKDIPYLTYGFTDTGDVTPSYPTETSDTTNTAFIDEQLFEGLVGYKDQINIVPRLAVSWFNPNDSTWVFNLRHGVKFHSGRTMTAADVKYSLDYAVANQNAGGGGTNLEQASTISSVTVVNPYQVKITTNGPDPVLLNRLANLFIVDSKAKLGDPDAGTGPYIVKPGSIKPNATSLDLVAFDSYWGGHVYTRAVHIQEEPTISKLAADTAAGDFTIAGDFNSQQLAQVKSKVSYYQPVTVPDLGLNFLQLNTERAGSPLESLAARQAAAYALNIPAIIKAGDLNGTQDSQIIPAALPGHDPSIPNTPYDPAKAKQLLSGVPNAATPLTLLYPTGDDAQVNEIAKQLNAVGFNVKASGIGDLGTLVNRLIAGQGDMFYLGYSSATLDGLDMINSTVAASDANYSNAELTTLIGQANATIDPTTRIAVLQKIERLVASQVPTIPLYSEIRTFALTKPYVIQVDLPSTDAGVYFWQVYQH